MARVKPLPATRQLSNSELGGILGMTPSGASKMRNGINLASARTLRTIVERLGGDLDELNRAMIQADGGDRVPWTTLIERLTTVPVEPAANTQRY